MDSDLSAILRPVVSSDRERAQAAFALLSEDSKLNRFWTRQQNLSSEFAARLTDTDDVNHVGWIAVPVDPSSELPGYGAASFWRDDLQSERAEFSITVLDEWQRKRFGSLLLSILWHEAWHAGIRTFCGVARRENDAMRNWWESAGGSVSTTARQHELTMPLENPTKFANRVEYDLHAGAVETELALWFRKWDEMTGNQAL